ncbi:alpha-glucan family phosphorylase [bacterium]|jgi:starch phosphorylase|nr:alpha-glucan family phosphorylase [bacterium]
MKTVPIKKKNRLVAYFCMEMGFVNEIPTYSGGLGILAGDTIKAAADLAVPMVGVTMLNLKGYFRQKLDEWGNQTEEDLFWHPEEFMKLQKPVVSVKLEGKDIFIRSWEYIIKGVRGYQIPVYFLDTDFDKNDEYYRTLTHHLYGGDDRYRLLQEAVMGIGGIKILEELGYKNIRKYHMNEGHAAPLALELLYRTRKDDMPPEKIESYDLEKVQRKCVFTTHTPVPAGHDKFNMDLVKSIFKETNHENIPGELLYDGMLNMTYLALKCSEFYNAVSKKHRDISLEMFPGFDIHAITNGVHSLTWTSEPFKKLYDKYLPDWKLDPFTYLREAFEFPSEELWSAHMEAKKEFLDYVNKKNNSKMKPEVFTIGFARRATGYKRADLILSDSRRLVEIAEKAGPIQIVFSGKAHPKDQTGKDNIKRIFEVKKQMKDRVSIEYLENYDIKIGGLITSGVDLWLNNPVRPLEASGTSGMKASHNGIPNLSVLDGWWIEGHIENLTGWSIGPRDHRILKEQYHPEKDVFDLYNKLEYVIIPLFYDNRGQWIRMMKASIAINASFFNTYRMLQQYVSKAYFHHL